MSLGVPDTIERDMHLLGLNINPIVLPFASTSEISFWCLTLLLDIMLKSLARRPS